MVKNVCGSFEKQFEHSRIKVFAREVTKILIEKKQISLPAQTTGVGVVDGTVVWHERDKPHKKRISIERSLDNKYILFELDYYFFKKLLYCTKTKAKSKKKTNIYSATRGNGFSKGGEYFSVKKVRIKQTCLDKAFYTINDFVHKKTTVKKAIDAYVIFDLETCPDRTNKFVAYIGCFFILDHDKKLVRKEMLCSDAESYLMEFDFLSEFKLFMLGLMSSFLGIPKKTILFFGFNNHRFDNHFVLEYFTNSDQFRCNYKERFGKVTTAEFERNNIRIVFTDMIKFLPDVSLKEALEDYDCSNKMSFDIVFYNNMIIENDHIVPRLATQQNFLKCFKQINIVEKSHLKKKYAVNSNGIEMYDIYQCALDYCEQDVNGTYELFLKIQQSFDNLIEVLEFESPYLSCLEFVSPAHLSGLCLKSSLMGVTQKMTIKDPDFGRFINSSYFGGRVQMGFIGEYATLTNLGCYDVRSMYPLAMKANYPVIEHETDVCMGEHFPYGLVESALLSKNVDGMFFIAEFEVILPEHEYELCSFGPLPHRDEDSERLFFDNVSHGAKVLTSVHLKTAFLANYSFKIIKHKYNVFFVKNGPIFTDYMTLLGRAKANAQQNDNKSLKKLIKLLLNSTAGKLAQKVTNKFHFYDGKWNIKYEAENWNASTHYLAAFVTSYSNHILYSTFYDLESDFISNKIGLAARKGALCYCDTDSIFFDKTLCKQLTFDISDDIGTYANYQFGITWSTKYPNANGIIIVGKKSYFILDYNKPKQKIIIDKKLKGIHKFLLDEFSIDVIRRVIQNEPKTVKQEFLMRKARKEIKCVNFTTDSSFIKDIFVDTLQKTLTVSVLKNVWPYDDCEGADLFYKQEEKNREQLKNNSLIFYKSFI